jgi:hypothetical protein
MRLVSSLFALAVLGCCFGPSVEAPPAPAPEAPSPLSQALSGMGVAPTDPAAAAPDPAAVPAAAPADPAAVAPVDTPVAPPTAPPTAAPTAVSSPACAAAQADREVLRTQLRELRLTLGAETGPRLEAASAQMAACDRDIECLKDAKIRMARIVAYDNAKGAQLAESNRLAQAELGAYDADQRVLAACGTP